MLVLNPPLITLDGAERLAQAAAGKIDKIYLHWTAGRYLEVYDEYHFNIGPEGEIYQTCNALTELKAHTYKRNSGAAAIALSCCYGAKFLTFADLPLSIGWGAYPPTAKQISSMASLTSVLAQGLGLALTPDAVLTHAEAALRDGYGYKSRDPEMRWDLLVLPDYARNKQLAAGGDLIRGLALEERQHGKIS